MNFPLISIIVAIYNVEEYLPKCVESILNQTYSNIELILVVDGSPDNSLQICERYAAIDSRVKVLYKENGGQSTARNAGLDIAEGEYVGFVDGDDWIESNMYKELYELLIREKADIVQCGWYIVDDSGNKKCPADTHFLERYTSNAALDELIACNGGHLNTSVCTKLFSRNVACESRFLPVRAYEDDDYVFKTVAAAKKIVCVDSPLYNYFTRSNSTMTAAFNLNKVALVTVQSNICRLIKDRYPERFNEVQKILCSKQFYILSNLLNSKSIDGARAEAERIKADILSSYNEYISNPQLGINKVMLMLLKYSPSFVWNTILKIRFS